MGRAHTIQTNFTSGELSPLLRGREDVNKYFNGAEKLENFLVKPQGGAWRRSGTQYIAEVRDSSKKVRLLEFQFAVGDAYVLEFGSFEKTITGVTQANPAVVTTSGNHNLRTGDTVYITGIVGMTELNNRSFTVTRVDENEFSLDDEDSSAYTAYSSGGTAEAGYMRVFDPSQSIGPVTTDSETITGATQANPVVVTVSGSHSYVTGDYVSMSGLDGMPEVDDRPFEVTYVSASTFQLTGVDGSGFSSAPTTGSVGRIYYVSTPWLEADLDDLYFTQSADVLYVAHPDYEPRKISRTAATATSFEVSTLDAQNGPYLPLDTSDTSMKLSSITDRATATADGFTFTDPTDVGLFIEYVDGDGIWGLGEIKSVESTTSATIEPKPVVERTVGDIRYEENDSSNPATQISSAFSGVFSMQDSGRFIRVRTTSAGTAFVWKYIRAPRIDNDSKAYVGTFATGGVTGYSPAAGGESLATNYVADGTDNVTVSGRTVTATLTASAAKFASTDVGRWIRLNYGTSWVDCQITAYTSTTVVSVSINPKTPVPKEPGSTSALGYEFINDASTTFWRLGAWSDTTGWPAVTTFHQQRLWFANTASNPDTVWSSKVDDYENFQPTEADGTVLDDSAITATIASNQVNAIKWIESGPVLLIGTLSNEFQLRSASNFNEPLTPTNIDIKTQTNVGTLNSMIPQRIGSSVCFIQRAGRKVYDLRYSFEADSYVSRDLNILSEHLLRDQTKGTRLRYQKTPNSILWCLTEDGALLALTHEQEQEVFAWSRHIIAGTDAVVESIAVIPSADGTEDELWMVVKRTVNSATVRYVEKLLPDFNPSSATDKTEMKYVDSMKSYSAASATIYALDHLEGETVQVVLDGERIDDKTVSSGSITLSATGTTAIVGLGYTSKIKTMPPAPQGDWGSSGGSLKKVPEVKLQVLNSLGHKAGRSESDLFTDDYRTVDDDMDEAPDLYTGWREMELPPEVDYDGQVWIQQDEPHPLNVLNLVTVVEVPE